MKNKVVVWVVLVAVALSSMGFYLDYRSSHIVLTFGMFTGSNWDVPYEGSYTIFENAIERFEKKYPNVSVHFTSGIPKDEYPEWLSERIVQGETPDVFMVLSKDFPTFADTGVLRNINALIAKDYDFTTDHFYEASLQAGYFKNAYYALPFESVPTMMYVNRTLLESEGIELPQKDWTWDDFYRICKKVTKDTDGDGRLDQFGAYDYTWDNAVYSNGAQLFDRTGSEVYIKDKKVREALFFIRELNALNQGINVTSEDFDEGKVAFCPMQFSQYRAYAPYPWKVKRYSSFEWDCIPLPKGSQGENISEVETLLMGMSNTTKHTEYAWEFLKELCYSKETQMDIFELSTGVSVLKEVTNSDEAIAKMFENNPEGSTFEMHLLGDVMENGMMQFRFKKYESIMRVINDEMYRIVESDNDIQMDLDTLSDKVILYMQE